jgi:hypothetical protein
MIAWEDEGFTFSQHTLLGFDIVFKVSRSEPDFYALTYVLNCVGENHFRVVGSLIGE